jgi:hypothetical protein
LEQSIYLIIFTHEETTILKYQPLLQKFISIQFEKKFFNEYFLALSNNETTILYKYTMKSFFVPFQEIGPADQIISISKRTIARLLLIREKMIYAYKFNGWRFDNLNFQLFGIKRLKGIMFNDKNKLLFETIDDTWSLNRFDNYK